MKQKTSSEQILLRNTVEANIYASRLLLVYIIINILSYGYYIAANSAIVIPTPLILANAALLIVCLLTYFYVQHTNGHGALIPHIIILELILGSCQFSLGWHIMVWPLFLLGLVYSVRYSNIKFTAIMGFVTSIGMIFCQFVMIPFGYRTGYVNLNLFELSQNTNLNVKAEYTGLYNAVVKSGLIDWNAVYTEALIDLIPNLLVMVGITIALCSIAKYNRRIINVEVAAAEQKAKSEQKSTFLFNMSHDIRTPMNAIIGFTEMLRKNLDDKEKALDYIQKIQNSNQFLLSFVNNVLDMTRIESGKVILQENCVPMKNMITSFMSLLEVIAKKKHVKFEYSIKLKHEFLLCDATKNAEIHQNVLNNALKFTPMGGAVKMEISELSSDKPGYVLTKTVISDTGIGMSKEFLPHIFESFEREKNSTDSKVPGAGLGMAITKRLADLMQGTIDIKSTQGVGTTVTILLPHKLPTDEQIKAAKDDQENDRGSSSKVGIPFETTRKRILLAEDNDLNAEISISILEELGYSVDRVFDGSMCLQKITMYPEGYYSLVLMDIQMPNMNGFEASLAIRELEGPKSKIPIVAMTANVFEEDRKRALESGMNDHLSKPISLASLSAALQKYVV